MKGNVTVNAALIQTTCLIDKAASPQTLSLRATKKEVLLSPPGVFGGIETGQVFVLFDDIHLFTGPTKQRKSY